MGVQIQQLKENLKKNGLRGLALDIDDTLSETNAHWYDHMVKFSGPKDLTKEKWQSLSFFYQMANIGAEIGRTITWKKKDLQKRSF